MSDAEAYMAGLEFAVKSLKAPGVEQEAPQMPDAQREWHFKDGFMKGLLASLTDSLDMDKCIERMKEARKAASRQLREAA